ncbi:hypothetical protein AAII07_01025 [Microvirga sp. 0TCS3.31]
MYSTAEPDDHCLVHHFIRMHGRRPTAEELSALRPGPAAIAATAPAPPPQHTAMPGGLTAAVRRELAKLVTRW